MKKYIYTLATAIIFLASCKSVDKMVEQGKYDEAIIFASEKMEGEENKKTKYVVGLEEAFAKSTKKDLDRIAFLMTQGNDENWSRIYYTFDRIKRRQDRVSAFLPLVSEDGYKAEFQFVRVNERMKDAADKASAYYYTDAVALMVDARKGDKYAAQSAVRKLEKIDNFYANYRDKKALKDEGYFLGTTRVLVKMKNDAAVIIPKSFEQEVLGISVRDLNTTWTEYFLEEARNVPVDVIAELKIIDMGVGPNREYVNYYTDTKEITELQDQTDRNGNVLKDSLGNVTQVYVSKTLSAYVTEVRRSKDAQVRGQLLFTDKITNERLSTRPIRVEAIFDEWFCTYNGDRKALSSRTRNRLNNGYAVGFPSDFDLTMEAAEILKNEMKSELRRQSL